MKRAPLKVGDVFSVPIDEARVGVGQVVALYGKHAYFLAIFDLVRDATNPINLADITDARLMFLTLSMDAKLVVGHWTLVGNAAVRSDLPLPAFKEASGQPENIDVVDFSGNRRRAASQTEAELLTYRKVVAPVRLEKALRAKHGLEPWTEAYSDLAPNESMTTRRLFG